MIYIPFTCFNELYQPLSKSRASCGTFLLFKSERSCSVVEFFRSITVLKLILRWNEKKSTPRFEMSRVCSSEFAKGRHAYYSSLQLVKKYHVTIWGRDNLGSSFYFKMAADRHRLSCEYCNYTCRVNESDYFFKHLIKFHSNEPNFVR